MKVLNSYLSCDEFETYLNLGLKENVIAEVLKKIKTNMVN